MFAAKSRLPARPTESWSLIALLCAAMTGGCATWYGASADREVHAVLRQYQQHVLGDRDRWVQRPAPAADEASASQPTSAPTPGAGSGNNDTHHVDVAEALRLAFTSSRGFLDRREQLYVGGLDYTLTRYNFGPILNATIGYVWSDAENEIGSDSHRADFSVAQVLPTGGDVTFTTELAGFREADEPPAAPPDEGFTYNANMQVSLRQPLLRGAGYQVAWEDFTQARRALVYAVRSFELFRQDFCVTVAEAYYRLVSRKMRLANDEQNARDAEFDRERAEALRQLDRAKMDDVFLARRREIEAKDALLAARTDYRLAVDDFKILLGLPTATPLEIGAEEPAYEAFSADAASAVRVALLNRLDLHTERDRVDDLARRVVLARNALLPDLDLAANYRLDGRAGDLNDTTPDIWSGSVGVELEIPLDRKAERNAYRAAQLALQQARRDLEQREDEVERDVLDQLRQLAQVESQIKLQVDQIEFETRAVEIMEVRYDSGDVSTRDKLEARQALNNARNRLIDLKVQHFVARLRLLRNLGILFVDEDGMWQT